MFETTDTMDRVELGECHDWSIPGPRPLRHRFIPLGSTGGRTDPHDPDALSSEAYRQAVEEVRGM